MTRAWFSIYRPWTCTVTVGFPGIRNQPNYQNQNRNQEDIAIDVRFVWDICYEEERGHDG